MVFALKFKETLEGIGRKKKRREPKTRSPSHYQFANWAYDDGKRFAAPVGGVAKDKRSEYSLISTAIKNAGSDTETLVWLHFDLDFKRADKKWRRDEMLDWPTMAETLSVAVPELFKYLTAVTRSSGGKGLGLALAVSPLELTPETGDVQKLAYRLQASIIRVLNYYGMGADEGARGLKRLMPNLFQPDRLLDRDEVTEAIVQTRRPRVIQQLLYVLRFHPALKAPSKASQSDLLWGDIRVELPCARLYTDLLDSVGPWGSEQRTAQEIISRYGMSKNTAYKFLSDPPKWLSVERIGGEGYRLCIRPAPELTNRAYTLIEAGGEGRAKGSFPSFATAAICAPEEVLDGDRNQWLVSVVLACKWKGVARTDLLAVLKDLVRLVPGYQESRSLTRELQSIVRSLYHHRSSLIGSSPDLALPTWMDEALDPDKSNRLSQIFPMKGTEGSRSPVAGSGLDLGILFPPSQGRTHAGVQGGLGPGVLHAEAHAVEGGVANLSRSISGEPETSAQAQNIQPCDAKPLLSSSALRSAFSKALLRSALSAEEKGGILERVSSMLGDRRDEMMRLWLEAEASQAVDGGRQGFVG